MKKLGIITFHSSHNYGSNLLSYATYKTIDKLVKDDIKVEFVDLRNAKRDNKYAIYRKGINIKFIIYNIIVFFNYKRFKSRHQKFEDFINELPLSEDKYKNNNELINKNPKYDYLLSASDQTWNTKAGDFDWSYYLNFSDDSVKISFSNSIGPRNLNLTEEEKEKVKNCLLKYDFISVRDKLTKDMVTEISGKNSDFLCDPTMMLKKEEWLKLVGENKIKDGKYIFFYTLGSNKKMIQFVKKLSKILKMEVVVPIVNNQYELLSGFTKIFDVGPKEFLNLLYNSDLVIASSFHGAVFSLILNKSFYIVRRLNDNRSNALLKMFNIEARLVDYDKDVETYINYQNQDFDEINNIIEKERNKAIEYLKKTLK